MAVIKTYKALLPFDDIEYFKGVDRVPTGLGMALNETLEVLYITDRQAYTMLENQ